MTCTAHPFPLQGLQMTANATLIVNARLVNEGREYDGDLRIADGRIA